MHFNGTGGRFYWDIFTGFDQVGARFAGPEAQQNDIGQAIA